MQNDRDEDFGKNGFLGEAARSQIPGIQAEHPEAFALAFDVSRALQAAALTGMETLQGEMLGADSVAMRLFIRGLQTYQALLILAERGLVTETQTLLRSLLEDLFCMGALVRQSGKFLEMLKVDAEASRREQGKFLLAQGLLGESGPDIRDRLEAVVAEIGRDPAFMSPKKVAGLSPMQSQYLLYQKLSNDAAHPSAISLMRHVTLDKLEIGWKYRWGPGSKVELAFSLKQAILAAVGFGVAFTQLPELGEHNLVMLPLAERAGRLEAPHSSPGDALKKT